jgi:hypothetical protein
VSGDMPPLPNTPSWRCVQLKKHRDNFTFHHSNIIFHSMPRSSSWPLPFRFSNQNFSFITFSTKSMDTSVGIATDYGLDDRSSNSGGGWEFFSSPYPDRL